MTNRLLVLLAESDEITAAILARSLAADAIAVIRAPATVVDLEVMVAANHPQVFVLGPTYPRGNMAGAITRILSHGTRTLVLSERALDDVSAQLLLSGASGFLLVEEASPRDIPQAVRTIASGASALHPAVVHTVLERWRGLRTPAMDPSAEGRVALPSLTSRELDVLRGMRDGLTNRMLASRLGISDKTVEAHKSRLYAKLGARNQPHAISVASDFGFL
jgi:DNA-binding NarL/FixJ family response regulator